MTRAALIAAVAALLLAESAPLRADSAVTNRAAALDAGVAAFEEAVALQRSSPEDARAQYQRAADEFESAARAGTNAWLEYNLGNTYFRLDDLGRAVLHLKRAERLAPGDGRIRSNLQYVRERVTPLFTPPQKNRLLESILFLHYQTGLSTRLAWSALAGVIGWGCLFAALWTRRSGLYTLAGIGIFVGATLGASTIWQLHDESARPHAVVTRTQPLKMGRGEGHDAVISQPLGPGVEVRILESRGGWVRLELPDGKTGWLPEDAVARV
jgi:tetratricopeptide (TPR) repeat protein